MANEAGMKRHRTLLFCIALIMLASASIGLFRWQAKRQDVLDQKLMSYVFVHDAGRVQLLLAQGADANARRRDRPLPSLWQSLLDWRSPKETTIYRDYPALGVAAYTNDTTMIKLLLKAGADINIKSSFGRTPLIWAAMCNQPGSVRLLLQSSADTHARDNTGRTALQEAQRYDYKEMVSLLREAGVTE